MATTSIITNATNTRNITSLLEPVYRLINSSKSDEDIYAFATAQLLRLSYVGISEEEDWVQPMMIFNLCLYILLSTSCLFGLWVKWRQRALFMFRWVDKALVPSLIVDWFIWAFVFSVFIMTRVVWQILLSEEGNRWPGGFVALAGICFIPKYWTFAFFIASTLHVVLAAGFPSQSRCFDIGKMLLNIAIVVVPLISLAAVVPQFTLAGVRWQQALDGYEGMLAQLQHQSLLLSTNQTTTVDVTTILAAAPAVEAHFQEWHKWDFNGWLTWCIFDFFGMAVWTPFWCVHNYRLVIQYRSTSDHQRRQEAAVLLIASIVAYTIGGVYTTMTLAIAIDFFQVYKIGLICSQITIFGVMGSICTLTLLARIILSRTTTANTTILVLPRRPMITSKIHELSSVLRRGPPDKAGKYHPRPRSLVLEKGWTEDAPLDAEWPQWQQNEYIVEGPSRKT